MAARNNRSPKIRTERVATRGNEQFVAYSIRGGQEFSAFGPTRAAAASRFRRGIGKQGG